MKEEIIELLASRGELKTSQIKIPGANPRNIINTLIRMAQAGVLNRRLVDTPKSQQWAYTLIDTTGPYLRNEPDYVYYLRTLGKRDECESC